MPATTSLNQEAQADGAIPFSGGASTDSASKSLEGWREEQFKLKPQSESEVQPVGTLAQKRGRSLANETKESRNGVIRPRSSVEARQGQDGKWKVRKLDHTHRNLNPLRPDLFDNVQDSSNVAIISREASQSRHRFYKNKVVNNGIIVNPGPKVKDISDKFDGKIGKSDMVDFNQARWVNNILADKQVPHVLVFIEGVMDTSDLVIQKNGADITYEHQFSRPGKSKKGVDTKQDMHFFVRRDLTDAYRFEEIKVEKRKNKSVNRQTASPEQIQEVHYVAMSYETVDGKKYQQIFVHIPHAVLEGEDPEGLNHEAFVHYAEEKKNSGVIVTGYAGDTNFKKPRQKFSVPSTAGIYKTNQTLESGGSNDEGRWSYFSPRASSAKDPTYFMQHVSFDELHELPDDFASIQPRTLNLVFPPTKALKEKDPFKKIGIDHPSIMTSTLHTSPINVGAYIDYSQDGEITITSLSLSQQSDSPMSSGVSTSLG